jgi:hypothetical protein
MGKKLRFEEKKRIGILLTDSKNEGKKEEIISLRRRIPPREWLKNVDFKINPDFKIDREAYKLKYFDIDVPRTVGVATDVSIGEYLKKYYGDTFTIDYIRPKAISKERLAQNDINFLIIYDLLESFHIDRTQGKRIYHNFLDVVRCSDNIFPSWELQEFVCSKLIYYNTFKSVGIPIAPTHTLTRDELNEQIAVETEANGEEGATDRVILKILSKIKSENWGKFIAKPVMGQESKACKTFRPSANLQKMFTKYVITTMKKYPGLIFQQFIPGFGESIEVPEVRLYWVGKEYQFSMVSTQTRIYCLAEEGHNPKGRKQNGMMKLPKGADLQTLKDIAMKVIDVLQSKVTTDAYDNRLPLLMTRVDMGVMRDGEFKPWVNEVEYVPSYYVEDHTHAIEGTVARQCAVIAKKYLGIDDKLIFDNSRNVDLEKAGIEPIPGVTANTNSKVTTESTAPLIESRITPVNKAAADQPSVEKDRIPPTEPTTLDDTLTMDSSVVLEVIPNDMTMDIDI